MKQISNQRGSILIAIMIMMPFFILIATAYLRLAVTQYSIARKDQYRTYAQFAVDAGIDYAVEKLNEDADWAGTGSEVEVQNTGGIKTTFQVAVTDIDDENKTISSTGRTYQNNQSTAASSININAEVRGVGAGAASVVTGVGGMVMLNSSKVVDGSVYVNGTLSMSNSAQIGLSAAPVSVKVAHQACPTGASPGPTYPRVCATGENGQPISINNTAHIYGTVEATNQTSGTGMSNTGLDDCNESSPGDCPDPISLPGYDRNAQKAAVASEITGSAAGCSSGTRTWPANLKINGNVTVSGTCTVTVQGNVWITGNLVARNSAQIKVNTGLSAAPVIMIDGSGGLNMRNSSTLASNSNPTGFRIITYYNSTGNPDATLTGNDLYNSKNTITIDIDNSASGPNTEFYARWSKLTAGNSGGVGALVAQTVELKNSLAVTFGTSVTDFSGEKVWVIKSYKRTF